MINKTNIILYIISGICFSAIITSWVGYIKFMNITPKFEIVEVTDSFVDLHGEVIIENNDYCEFVSAVSWPRESAVTTGSRLFFKAIPNDLAMIPIFVNYECNYVIFKKSGNQLIYANLK